MRLIPFLASLSGCIAELQTQCTSDDQYIVSLPYTIQNSTLLSATAGICSEKNITYAQDVATFNVTIDINRCKLNTKTYPKPKVQAKNLFMANITNLKVGRTGNGMSFTYLDMDIATECGRQMSYEITHEYGAIASAGSLTPDVGVNETDVILPGAKAPFTFSFQEYTNLFFNETRATGPRQAGTKSFVTITATNMDVSEYSFHVPSCKVVTTTGKEQALFRSLSEENSFIDLYKGYRTKNGNQEFMLSHIFFVLDRNSTARYNLTCDVRVCAKNHLGESCDVVQSCSTNPCVHGKCQDKMSWQTNAKKTDYTCTCEDNYKGTNCDQAVQLDISDTFGCSLLYTWDGCHGCKGCDGWRGVTQEECNDKCQRNEIPAGCAQKNRICRFASWVPTRGKIGKIGWCHLAETCTFNKSHHNVTEIRKEPELHGKRCKNPYTIPMTVKAPDCDGWNGKVATKEECNNKCRLNEFPSNCPEAKGKRCQFATWHRSGYCHLNEQCDFGPSSNGIVTKIRG